jgi:hypothetical protein
MQHPKFSTVLGLLQESKSVSNASRKIEKEKVEEVDMFDRFSKSLKNVWKEIF